MRTLTQTAWVQQNSNWFSRTMASVIHTAEVAAHNTFVAAKITTLAVATVAVSSVKVVTGSFGTSRFNKMTNNAAYRARASAMLWMPLVAAFEFGYFFMLSLILLLSGGPLLNVMAFFAMAMTMSLSMALVVGIVSEICISVIISLYSSIKGSLNEAH